MVSKLQTGGKIMSFHVSCMLNGVSIAYVELPDHYFGLVVESDGAELASTLYQQTGASPHYQTLRSALIRRAKNRKAKGDYSRSPEWFLKEVADKAPTQKNASIKTVTVTKNKPLALPGMPRKRGRPVTGKALSNAERQRKHREKQAKIEQFRLEGATRSFQDETDAELLQWLLSSGPVLQEKAWLELGRRKGWKLP